MSVKISCDICGRSGQTTGLSKHNLEKNDWLIYCRSCADRIGLTDKQAREDKIKIYKF